MERHFYGVLCVFIITFTLIHLAQSQDQKGFISLDCGLSPQESPYTEKNSLIKYISDSSFIKSGRNGRIQKDLDVGYGEQYLTLRYFPDGERNCYTLNVTQGTNYLIRAIFLYANYDGLNNYPNFDMFIGPNKWLTVDLAATSGIMLREMIHVSKFSSLQICLVKTGTTTPMISALELRPLPNDTYISDNGSSLNHLVRLYLSNITRLLRFPFDVYDRTWLAFSKKEWTALTTTLNVNTSNGYNPPQIAMASAATHENDNGTWNIFSWNYKDAPQVLLYLHFAEIETLLANDTREFNVLLNGIVAYGPYSPKTLSLETIVISTKTQEICGGGTCSLQLARTEKSTLPPLINAFELNAVIEFPQSETNQDDVVAINILQEVYGLNKTSWQGDPCVPRKFLWAGLTCNNSDTTSIPPTITSLNLTSSGLTGIIAPAIKNLIHLQELDLSNNNLTGDVPEFLADMKSLLIINLSGNNLSGQVPQKLLQKKGLNLNVQDNPKLLCIQGSCVNKPRESGHSKKSILVPVVASVASLVVVVAALVLFFVLKNKKSSKSKVNGRISRTAEPPRIMKKKVFTYAEITEMTNNFEGILGEGGFGMVYHGFVNGREQVAVKLLSESSIQGNKQFKAEVELLIRVHHKNLVSLVGYCEEGNVLALVYEYMANGDLKELLSTKRDGSDLSWGTRLKIVIDASQGLEYLHKGCKPPIVHRDVKSSNILLDENFQAKLSDFGLSRSFLTEGETHVSTVVAGTLAYLDPEYYRTNWLTEKSDVYSFGIVLLEIITNQAVIDQSREKPHIKEWAGLMITKGDIRGIIDPSLHGDYQSDSVWKAIELAMSCLNPSSARRPTMSQVVVELKECLTFENSRGGASQSMNSESSINVTMTVGTEVNPMAR